jgi:hypothetical protein
MYRNDYNIEEKISNIKMEGASEESKGICELTKRRMK